MHRELLGAAVVDTLRRHVPQGVVSGDEVAVFERAEVADAHLQSFAREHLAGYKVPKSFDRTDEIPRSASGKILKRQLRAPFWEGHSSNIG